MNKNVWCVISKDSNSLVYVCESESIAQEYIDRAKELKEEGLVYEDFYILERTIKTQANKHIYTVLNKD